ncbi:MAG: (2Fe-2S)-binding protein [Candidatus Protistobacter heckmanni]|nr:(2Fe-2S)-binding protein [Candidatus Protistobacter heckmanni]
MYICICNGVSEKAIHAEVADGARTYADLQARTGVGTCCGQCTGCACDTLADALAVQGQPCYLE